MVEFFGKMRRPPGPPLVLESRKLPVIAALSGFLLISCISAEGLFPDLDPTAARTLNPADTVLDGDLQCTTDSRRMKTALENRTMWAVRMQDASAAGVSGVMFGARYQLGSFDGCLAAGRVSPVGSRYCLARLSATAPADLGNAPAPELRLPQWDHVDQVDPYADALRVVQGYGLAANGAPIGDIRVALCVPASCGPAVLERALRDGVRAGAGAGAAHMEVRVEAEDCVSWDETPPERGGFWFWLVLCTLITSAIVAGALGDKLPKGSLLRAWDPRTHLAALSAPDPPLAGVDLVAVTGLRGINSMLLMLVHNALHVPRGLTSNNPVIKETTTYPGYAPMTFAQAYVDTSFFLAGLLMTLVNPAKDPVKSLVLRYLRLTPSYAFVLLMYCTVLEWTGSGPIWKSIMGQESDACRKQWWINLLYINNYVGDPPVCMVQTWSLACDMHMFIFGTVLLWACCRWRRATGLLVTLAVLSAVVPVFLDTLLQRRWPIMVWNWRYLRELSRGEWWFGRYVPTHLRLGPYVVGMCTGGALVVLKGRSFSLSRRATSALTWGSVASLAGTMAFAVQLMDVDRPYDAVEAALVAALLPVFWVSMVGTLVVALVFGQPTRVRSFLLWQPFLALGRLSYSVYLVHFAVQLWLVAVQRTLFPAYVATLLLVSPVIVLWSYGAALALYILVEAPIRRVSKTLLSPKRPSSVKLSTNTPGAAGGVKCRNNNCENYANPMTHAGEVGSQGGVRAEVSPPYVLNKPSVNMRRRLSPDYNRSYVQEHLSRRSN